MTSRDREIEKEERNNKERSNIKVKEDGYIGKEIFLNISKNNVENKVYIIVEEMIGFGSYGNIYKICLQYPNGKKYYLAQKVFKQSAFLRNGNIPEQELENHIQKTLDTYHCLKKLKLPVWKTLRKTGDNKSLVMSLGSQGSKKILSTNKSKDKIDIQQYKIVIHPDDITQQLKYIRSISSQHNIELSRDAFLIQYDTNTQESKILIGDYDAVQANNNSTNGNNKEAILQFLQKFISKYTNIEKDEREKVMRGIESF